MSGAVVAPILLAPPLIDATLFPRRIVWLEHEDGGAGLSAVFTLNGGDGAEGAEVIHATILSGRYAFNTRDRHFDTFSRFERRGNFCNVESTPSQWLDL